MSAIKQIKATARTGIGKGAARATRREGRVPAVVYGGGEPPVSISLDYNQTNKLIYSGHFLTTVFDIDIDGKVIRALPRDYQLDVIKDTPLHVDFLRLAKGGTVRVEIPVHFINHEAAPGIKAGGTLNIVRHTVEMVVPADDIPDAITVDLTGYQFNDTARISAAKLPSQYKPTITDRDFVLANIAPPAGAEEEAASAAAETKA
jgi:large subunit ribosomal protein L25